MTNDSTQPTRDRPDIKVLPPLLYLGVLGLGFLLERLVALPALPRTPAVVLSAALLVPGLGLFLWSGSLFRRARTSPLPFRPTTALVFSGPFRFTRNPMYLGALLLYVALALWFSLSWALLLIPVLIIMVNRLVIRQEEDYLEGKFGEPYRRYKTQVRRWI